MADIDKALPNVEQTIELPSEEELVEAAQSEEDKVPNPENTEIVQGEDGSVEINFDPAAASPEEGGDHYANLAELLPDDILADMGAAKKDQFLVGFALETNNEIENAKSKLLEKNLDLIILNSLNDEGAGFETNTNKVTILSKDNEMLKFELKSKHDVANDIVNLILNEIDE